jgi:two-component system, OmpR family, sensor kinase
VDATGITWLCLGRHFTVFVLTLCREFCELVNVTRDPVDDHNVGRVDVQGKRMTIADLGRLMAEFRTKVIADLIGIASAVVLMWLLIAVLQAAGVDLRTAHLALTLVTVAAAGAVAVVVGAAATGHRHRASLSAAFGLFAGVSVALTALGPMTLHGTPALMVVLCAADLGVAVLLLLWATGIVPAGRWAVWEGMAAAVLVALVLGFADWRAPAVSTFLDRPVVHAGIALGWGVAAARTLVVGLRARDLPMSRVGLGLALLACAELYRAATGASAADPDLLFSGLRMVGALAVLGGVVGRNRGEVISLQVDREQQRAALRSAIKHLDGAAASAAERDHELANGLAGLAGIAYVLERPAVTADGAELRAAVLSEIARLHAMLAGSGQHGEDPPFDVVGVLSELAVLRRAGGMRVDVDAPDGLVAAGGRRAFSQSMANLLANCARHAPGSPVRLHAFETGDRVVVEVRDEGPGLPPGREQEVLERGATAAATGGSGLGLHVSARLLRERAGDLHVLPRQSDERGFAVRIELPSGDRQGSGAAAQEQATG